MREAGAYNETLVALLRQNVRIPDTVMGDLNAQIAACTIGARRLGELAVNFVKHTPNYDSLECAEPWARKEAMDSFCCQAF